MQGVGFRYWTERVATKLGLDGWVRNRRDGSVEAVFSGPRRCRRRDAASAATTARRRPASTISMSSTRTTHLPAGFEVKPTA